MRQFAPILIATLCCATNGYAQNVAATLIAQPPITAHWLNAPPGTNGAFVSHPAGPATTVALTAPPNGSAAVYNHTLRNNNGVWTLQAFGSAYVQGGYSEVRADCLLTLTAPPETKATLAARITHLGDTPNPHGFEVDLHADGIIEVQAISNATFATRYEDLVLDFANGPIQIRVTSSLNSDVSPQPFQLRLDITEWIAGVESARPSCGDGSFHDPSGWLQLVSDYSLDAVANPQPNTHSLLRARGLGELHWFLVSSLDQTQQLQLPTPFAGLCDVLSSNVLTTTGTVSQYLTTFVAGSAYQVPLTWQLSVPTLPPGLTLFVQQASLCFTPSPTSNAQFGISNTIRIDT